MRTTVTLEKDVEQMLRDAMHRTRRSFKETLNGALRIGLGGRAEQPKKKRFVVKALPMGLRAGFDPAGLNQIADELEMDTVLAKAGRRRKA